MTTAPGTTLAKAGDSLDLTARELETALLEHDLASMPSADRLRFYAAVCRSLGLNPLTRPFGYILTDGKVRFYALKDCTDQLRRVHGVSVTLGDRKIMDGVLSVAARARIGDREDEDIGCVDVSAAKGTALANAVMKCVTKAKRRVTLSICGLGISDESEVDSIPGAQRLVENATGELVPAGQRALPAPAPAPSAPDVEAKWIARFSLCETMDAIKAAETDLAAVWKTLPGGGVKGRIRDVDAARVREIKAAAAAAAAAANEDAEPPADVVLPDMGGGK